MEYYSVRSILLWITVPRHLNFPSWFKVTLFCILLLWQILNLLEVPTFPNPDTIFWSDIKDCNSLILKPPICQSQFYYTAYICSRNSMLLNLGIPTKNRLLMLSNSPDVKFAWHDASTKMLRTDFKQITTNGTIQKLKTPQ